MHCKLSEEPSADVSLPMHSHSAGRVILAQGIEYNDVPVNKA